MRETMRKMGAALLIAGVSGAGAMAHGTVAASETLPIPLPPPLPPHGSELPRSGSPQHSPRAELQPPPAIAAPSPGTDPGAACTRQDAKAKAERLLDLLRFLIGHDPNRAQVLLNDFQSAVQRFQDGSADLAATCRAYDGLIAGATE